MFVFAMLITGNDIKREVNVFHAEEKDRKAEESGPLCQLKDSVRSV